MYADDSEDIPMWIYDDLDGLRWFILSFLAQNYDFRFKWWFRNISSSQEIWKFHIRMPWSLINVSRWLVRHSLVNLWWLKWFGMIWVQFYWWDLWFSFQVVQKYQLQPWIESFTIWPSRSLVNVCRWLVRHSHMDLWCLGWFWMFWTQFSSSDSWFSTQTMVQKCQFQPGIWIFLLDLAGISEPISVENRRWCFKIVRE